MSSPETHGHTANGKYSPTYSSWQSMIDRCRRKHRKPLGNYDHVEMCERWKEFEAFLSDMGERPSGKTLDRIDSAKGYSPENCRWATPTQQARNTKRNVLTFDMAKEIARRRLMGEPSKNIAKSFGISPNHPNEIYKGRIWKDALEAARKEITLEKR